jgi:hypothetical protein
MMYRFDLEFPAQSPAPYRFAELDWNPHGHEPPGIYTVPHMGLHWSDDAVSPISVPARYTQSGWYPTSYRVTYDAQAKEYRVALSGMVQH